MSSILNTLKKIQSSILAAYLTAFLGAAAFLGQSAVYLFRLPSTLDEGNYLYKGYLFATGVLWPYQDYGVWTNKMPFAFLIPGWVQALFGPGLRTGRYFAVFLGLLMLLGLWIVARRLAGRWWAAGVVLVIALNPGMIRMLDQALSEGLVACLLVWVLVLIMAEKRSIWQTTTGAVLASVAVLTRENMLPVLLFVIGYIWWQHSRRQAIIAAATMAVIILGIHAIFWPNIITIWTPWIPRAVSPFLDYFRPYLEGVTIWDPDLGIMSRIYSFWEGMRYHFVPLTGTLVTLLLWPRKENWKSPFNFRSAVVLTGIMIVMTLAHIWAALGKNYCVFCFPLYLTFFSPLGLLLVAAAFPTLAKKLPIWRDVLAGLFVLILGAGMGYGSHQDLDEILLNLQVPRIRNLQIQSGFTELWRMMANKFALTYDQLKQIIPSSAGLLIGIVILLVAAGFVLFANKNLRKHYSVGALAILICFVTGTLLTPSIIFGNAVEKDCGGDVVASYEIAAPVLREAVPPGSLVFWEGGLAPIPLLYLPDITIFGPLLNDGYSFRTGGDSDRLFKFGYWNADLSNRWIHSADILLIEDRAYKRGYNQVISPDEFDQIAQTPVILTCRESSSIRIFRRKP
jgi:hypothetical protein